MAYEVANAIQALCSIVHNASPAVPAYLGSSPGFNPSSVNSTHAAVGVYQLVLDDAITANEGTIIATPRSANPDANIAVEHTSDTLKTIRTGLIGVASDLVDFDVVVYRRPG